MNKNSRYIDSLLMIDEIIKREMVLSENHISINGMRYACSNAVAGHVSSLLDRIDKLETTLNDLASTKSSATHQIDRQKLRREIRKVLEHHAEFGTVAIQSAWILAGGTPNIIATEDDLRIALIEMDKTIDEML